MTIENLNQAVRRPALKVVIPVMLFCAYYPYSWLILSKDSWTGYHWTWIFLWPTLPALITRIAFFHQLPDILAFSATLMISILLVSGLIYLASRRSWLFPVVAVITFLLSAINSMLAYQLFRT